MIIIFYRFHIENLHIVGYISFLNNMTSSYKSLIIDTTTLDCERFFGMIVGLSIIFFDMTFYLFYIDHLSENNIFDHKSNIQQ